MVSDRHCLPSLPDLIPGFSQFEQLVVAGCVFGKITVIENKFCSHIAKVLLKPRTTDPPTHRLLTHRPTDRLLLTYVKIEDQILNMFCILSIILENFTYCII